MKKAEDQAYDEDGREKSGTGPAGARDRGLRNGEEITADQVLVSIGRSLNSEEHRP